MKENDSPRFPIKVIFTDGDVWTLKDEKEIGQNLEWIDSAEEPEPQVIDALGRSVRIKIEMHRIEILELFNRE